MSIAGGYAGRAYANSYTTNDAAPADNVASD
jgi:hypothetical protein